MATSRTAVPLTPEQLPGLAEESRCCLFWELDPVRRRAVVDAAAAKAEWVDRVTGEWGPCGQVLEVDGTVVGHVVYAPATYFPGAAGLPTAPPATDAVLLATAYVDPAWRGGGVGKVLVQSMARDLVLRGGTAAIEAFGSRSVPDHAEQCLLPEGFLVGVGFDVQRAHPTSPRLRMDLRSTVPWRAGIERAISRLRGAVRPSPRPARGQAMYSSSSLSSAALGLAPTIVFTTSPPE